MNTTSEAIDSSRVHKTWYNKIYNGTKNQKVDLSEREISKSLLNFIDQMNDQPSNFPNKSSHAVSSCGIERTDRMKQADDQWFQSKKSIFPAPKLVDKILQCCRKNAEDFGYYVVIKLVPTTWTVMANADNADDTINFGNNKDHLWTWNDFDMEIF